MLETDARIFVSYRRAVSGHAGRLADALVSRFPKGWVFVDEQIAVGVDFKQEIERHLDTCDLLLAIIHPDWANVVDAAGRKRLDDPADFVRLEIATAFARSVQVLPVLVGGAAQPKAADLPKMLRPLATLQPSVMRDEGWSGRVQALVDEIQRLLGDADRRRQAALAIRERREHPPLEWRAIVRGEQAALYELIADFMVRAHPIASRRGRLLGKAPEEIILTRRKGELIVKVGPTDSAGRTEVVMLADRDYGSDLRTHARSVVETRRVELP